MKVCIDAGHYEGYNKGVVPGYSEGTMTLDLAQRLKAALEGYGVQVVMTRTTGKDVALGKRGPQAQGCDVFLSLHSNAASGKPAVGGVSVFRSLKRADSVALARKLATTIAQTMGTGYHQARDGVCTRALPLKPNTDYYQVIRDAAATNCRYIYLIEHGFHTNQAECAWLDKAVNRQRLADAEAACLAAYFGLDKPAAPVKPTLYRFVTGSMTNGDAIKYRKALQQLQQETGVGYTESKE